MAPPRNEPPVGRRPRVAEIRWGRLRDSGPHAQQSASEFATQGDSTRTQPSNPVPDRFVSSHSDSEFQVREHALRALPSDAESQTLYHKRLYKNLFKTPKMPGKRALPRITDLANQLTSPARQFYDGSFRSPDRDGPAFNREIDDDNILGFSLSSSTDELLEDHCLNLLDWNRDNRLAVALKYVVYFIDGVTAKAYISGNFGVPDGFICSVAWSSNPGHLAVGKQNGRIVLWDSYRESTVCNYHFHTDRIGSIHWKDAHVLTSGGRDSKIITFDVRQSEIVSTNEIQRGEICGLKWDRDGRYLASGDTENVVKIWDIAGSSCTGGLVRRFDRHRGPVRALAWSPHKRHVLASGAIGPDDKNIHIWNTETGIIRESKYTGSEVCALQWDLYGKSEIMSSQGAPHNKLVLWSYPSMARLYETESDCRALNVAQCPVGVQVAAMRASIGMQFIHIFAKPRVDNNGQPHRTVRADKDLEVDALLPDQFIR